jgi:hypothetical protein
MNRKPMSKYLLIFLLSLSTLWVLLDLGVRLYVAGPLKTDFYSSIPRTYLPDRQAKHGVQVATGSGWVHMGWIVDPENETYMIEKRSGEVWREIGTAEFGSYLNLDGGSGEFRVVARPKTIDQSRVLASVPATPEESASQELVPDIAKRLLS